MPFKSQAQRRLFYARPELRKYIPEFQAATPAKLPERATPDAQKGNLNRLARKLGGRDGK